MAAAEEQDICDILHEKRSPLHDFPRTDITMLFGVTQFRDQLRGARYDQQLQQESDIKSVFGCADQLHYYLTTLFG